ncbi:MAG: ROK family protein [Geminicoccaceae bacterium]
MDQDHERAAPTVLVVDVGGNNAKLWISDSQERRKSPSGPDFTPQDLMAVIASLASDWRFDRITVGIPTGISDGRPVTEPHNLGPGWCDYDFTGAFSQPLKLINDAAMQALGSYEGGRMLFLGLGTGLGSALIDNGHLVSLELAHLPYKKDLTFEDCVGTRGFDRLGQKKWQQAVFDVSERLRLATVADYVVLGGGNAKKLSELPPLCRRGSNKRAFLGGYRLWAGANAVLPIKEVTAE